MVLILVKLQCDNYTRFRREFDEPYASDSRNFEFKIPAGPYSFSGLLISLAWALELELDKECLQYDIVVSPTGKEISLYSGANS